MVNCCDNVSIQSGAHYPFTTRSNEETILQDFVENLEELFLRYQNDVLTTQYYVIRR